jgi:tRNA C32,U32 (ribose-2'-O)-methylase TrmJ
MSVTLVIRLLRELEQRADTKKTQMLKGNCASFEEYKSTVEHYQALMSTIAYIKELAKEVDD